MQDWQAVRCALAQAENMILFPHIHADGDALGSAFGFAHFLCGIGKTVQIALEELPPANLSFLYAADALPERLEYFVFCPQNPQKTLEDALAVAVDTSDVKRLGSRAELFFKARRQLRIDHHISADTFAELTVCNPDWAATAEGIWELIKTYGSYRENPYIQKAAECIYTGILTDTGCFAYANVTAETHRIAAELIDLSGSMAWQYSRIYENQTKNEVALKAAAYQAVEYYADGKIAFLQITREKLHASGATEDDLESFASFLRSIEGVHIGIFVKPGKEDGDFRISLRSDATCDVAGVAAVFGGGGHKRAAGLTYQKDHMGPFAEFKKSLIGELIKWMV